MFIKSLHTCDPLFGHVFSCKIFASEIEGISLSLFFHDLLQGSMNLIKSSEYNVAFDDHKSSLITLLQKKKSNKK